MFLVLSPPAGDRVCLQPQQTAVLVLLNKHSALKPQ